jgi:hypothetical protein
MEVILLPSGHLTMSSKVVDCHDYEGEERSRTQWVEAGFTIVLLLPAPELSHPKCHNVDMTRRA